MTVSNVFMNLTVVMDKRRPFINDKTFLLLMLINPAIITSIISVFGLFANIANIVIFVKLGFKETINISLTTLAVTDVANLVFLLWLSLSYSPSFCGLVCDVIDMKQLEDAISIGRSYFTAVGGCITCVIACERCLCVLRPLQVKLLLTRKKLFIILPTVFIVTLFPYLPFLYTSGIGWVFNPQTNRSIIRVFYRPHAVEIDTISYAFIMAFNTSTYVILTIFTVLIVSKLASQNRWRTSQASYESSNASVDATKGKQKGLSRRDRRATVTVIVIATMYITCFFPGSILYMVISIVPEFDKGMLYTNLYDFVWYLAYVFESISSSVNIIVYLATSTKFKETFFSFFRWNSGNVTEASVNVTQHEPT